jgi:hypothetical protein
VRSVHDLLRSRLGFAEGLADPGVRLLDPAAGAMDFIRAARRTALGSSPCPEAPLRSRFTGIELRPDAQARGLAAAGRFARAVLADALAPAPEIREGSFNVVIGNPPWRGRSSNHGSWISGLLHEYFQIDGERNPKWLQDDYVKFLRLAEWLIERNGEGIVGFVLNHNFVDAPTFRGLRRSLLRTFQEIYVLDLHGNARRGESGNVFAGVAQGAAAVFLVRKPGLPARVLRADLDGSRREKLAFLARNDVASTPWAVVEPRAPGYLLVRGDRALEREYERGLPLPEIFPVHGTGIVTGRDAEVTGVDRESLRARFREAGEGEIRTFLARPFDLRFLLDREGSIARPRRALMSHLADGDTVGLVAARQCKGEPGALVTRWPVGHKVLCPHDVSSLFPLELRVGAERRPNLAPGLARRLGTLYGTEPEPAAILGYVIAILSSDTYRRRYRDLLRRSFPRITFPHDPRLFAPVAALGRELIELHLLRGTRRTAGVRLLGDPGRPLARRCRYVEATATLHLQEGLACAGIEPGVWGFRIGGYPVLGQWLRARAGRALDLETFRVLVEHVRQTIETQARIQEVAWD